MLTIPIALATHFASPRLTLAVLCRAVRLDGAVFGFTDVDIDLPVGGQLYRAGALGLTMSAHASGGAFQPDNYDVVGILSPSGGVTQDDILAGLWDGAALSFQIVNYRSLADGVLSEGVGTIGKISTTSLGFTAEFLDIQQPLSQNLLRTVGYVCDAVLGDARCKVDLAPFTRTATVGPSPIPTSRTFTDASRTEANGWWSGGNAIVTSSSNPSSVGMKMEIKTFTSGGHFELLHDLYYGIAPDDELTITPGCNHEKKRADGYTGDCVVKYLNGINFQGEDAILGQDAALTYQTT